MFRGLTGKRVVMNVSSEDAGFQGTVLEVRWFTVRLRDVTVLEPDGRQVTLPGIARFPRRSVTWIQEL